MAKRKWFDAHAALGALITDLERLPDLAPEPAAGFDPLAARVDVAVGELKRGLEALHRIEGDSAGVSIVLEDFERVCRRAARIGADAEGRA